jgi:hypothetical protein
MWQVAQKEQVAVTEDMATQTRHKERKEEEEVKL